MAASDLLTIDDFELLPAEAAENHELVEGELVDVSGNTPRHNELRDRLIALMLPWMRERGLGTAIAEQEFDFLGNAHGPDVSVLGPAKAAVLDLDRRVRRFVPDLAIEIASESDTYEGFMAKKERYLKSGTAEVWLFSIRTRELAIYGAQRTLTLRGADVASTDLMPGFSITIAELLSELRSPVPARVPARHAECVRHVLYPTALLRSGCAHSAAFQSPDLGIQIRQRLLHQIPVPGVLARFQFPKDPGARKIQSFPLSELFQFFRWNLLIERRTDLSLGRLNLRLDRFTFPTSCHTSIIRCGIAPGVALFLSNP